MARTVFIGCLVALATWAASPAVGDDMSPDMVRAILKRDGFVGAKVGLLKRIGAEHLDEFLPEVLSLVRDANPEVREAAAGAAGAFDWAKVGGPLTGILADKAEKDEVRSSVARTLGVMGRPAAVEPLLALVDDPALGTAAMAALGQITFQELPDAASWRRWWDENRSRTRIDWAQARMKELERRIADGEKAREANRKLAAQAEDKLGESAVKFLDARADRNDPAPLIAALDVNSLRVRRYAAAELGKLKARPAAAKLAELAGAAQDAPLRADCASALGEIAAPESVPALAAALADPSDVVASAAALALGKMKAEGATNRLLVGLLHPSAPVRAASAEALGKIGAPAAVSPLAAMVRDDKDASVRERAARSLGEIGDGRAREALEKALDDESPAVRVYAAGALGQIGGDGVAARLGATLDKDANPSVREAAAVSLGRLGGKDAVAPLVRAIDLKDDKLAPLAWTSLLDVCRRDGVLASAAGDDFARAARCDRAVAIYEVLEKTLAEKKDEAGLIAARAKLADACMTLKEWAKAAAALENLARALPADVGVAEKYAKALAGMGRALDALGVYQALGAHPDAKPYWDERLVLLDALAGEKKNEEALKAADAILGGDPKPSGDVVKRIEDLKKKCTAETGR